MGSRERWWTLWNVRYLQGAMTCDSQKVVVVLINTSSSGRGQGQGVVQERRVHGAVDDVKVEVVDL